MDKLLEYSMHLAMITRLHDEKLVTDDEYERFKRYIKRKYNYKPDYL